MAPIIGFNYVFLIVPSCVCKSYLHKEWLGYLMSLSELPLYQIFLQTIKQTPRVINFLTRRTFGVDANYKQT